MHPIAVRYLSALYLLVSFIFSAQAETAQHPLTASELMALVAGNVLSENVIHEVQTRGLAFHPSSWYKSQLAVAGAGDAIVSAVDAVRTPTPSAHADDQVEIQRLTHLANAGKLMRSKQYDQATQELTAALQDGAETEAGFVMGEMLERQEQYEMAASVYHKVLEGAPEFPDAHIKLSLALYRMEDYAGAMQEAKLALARTPDNADGHKTLGLSLMGMGKLDASITEYREALRIKPDYAIVHFDMGIALGDKHDSAAAMAEYKKANALDPDIAMCHYNLAILLRSAGDLEGSIREYREAKRVAPDRIDVRYNLATALTDLDLDASIREFRELVALAPDFAMAHVNLGLSLSNRGNLTDAEAEYRKALALDPSEPATHTNLGVLLEKEEKYDAAMDEYVRAGRLGDESAYAHWGMGRIYLHRKDYPQAVRELRVAETIDAAQSQIHLNLGEALAGQGDLKSAIAQMRQAQTLDPRNHEVMSKFAPILEASGDYNEALKQYHAAAGSDGTEKARNEYAAAQERLKDKLVPAKPANGNPQPNPAEAHANSAGLNAESVWRDTIDASHAALKEKRYGDAEKAAASALAIAEKLRPRDQRLVQSTFQVAWVYTSERKIAEAQASWQYNLRVSQEISGPESQDVARALEALAGCASMLKDYASAATFYARAIELNEKVFGPTNVRAISDLYMLGKSYQDLGAYDKAEPILLKLLETNSAAGSDGLFMQGDLLLVGKLYLAWGKLDKAESYCRKSLASRERSFGPDSPMLAESIDTLSEVLSRLGKSEEAAMLRQRHETIMSTAAVARP